MVINPKAGGVRSGNLGSGRVWHGRIGKASIGQDRLYAAGELRWGMLW